jgi:hypothetical protein
MCGSLLIKGKKIKLYMRKKWTYGGNVEIIFISEICESLSVFTLHLGDRSASDQLSQSVQF